MHFTKFYISFTWNINVHKDMGTLSTKLHKKPKLSWGNTRLGDIVRRPWSLWWGGNIIGGNYPWTLLRDFWRGGWWGRSTRGNGDRYKWLSVKKNQGPQLCWRKYSAIQQHTSSRMGMRGAKIQKEERLTVLRSGHSSIGLVDDQITQPNYRSSQESEAWPSSPSSLHL